VPIFSSKKIRNQADGANIIFQFTYIAFRCYARRNSFCSPMKVVGVKCLSLQIFFSLGSWAPSDTTSLDPASVPDSDRRPHDMLHNIIICSLRKEMMHANVITGRYAANKQDAINQSVLPCHRAWGRLVHPAARAKSTAGSWDRRTGVTECGSAVYEEITANTHKITTRKKW